MPIYIGQDSDGVYFPRGLFEGSPVAGNPELFSAVTLIVADGLDPSKISTVKAVQDFCQCSYERALELCQQYKKIGVVIFSVYDKDVEACLERFLKERGND